MMANSSWMECKLEDFVTIHNAKRIPLSSMERKKKQGIFPYYGASGIIDYVDDFIFDGEYVLISEDGENLKSRKTPIAFIASGKFWVNNHAHIVKGKKPYINKLITYYFQNLDVNPFLTGAVQPKLNKKNLMSVPIFLPNNEAEQKAIASILSSLDDKIDLLHLQNQTLEALAESLFRQWFIEEAKEDWEECTVGDLSIHSKISVHPKKNLDTLYHHYSIPSFDANKKPIVELGIDIQSNKYKVESNSILFSKLNPHKDKRLWLILDALQDNSICSTEFQVVKPKDDIYLYFLYGWLTHSAYYNEIASGVGGTSGSHQRIEPKSIFTAPCIKMDKKIIVDYNVQVDPLFKKQIENQQQIQTLTKLRDTLLPKLMSGEVRVKIDSN